MGSNKKAQNKAGAANGKAVIMVELRRADQLVPYPRNARVHSEAHVAEIAGAILEFGWTNPILHDDFIRAGHARVKAALRIYGDGKTIKLPNGTELPPGMVPVIDCSGWSEAQKRAYVLADNKLTENADWDRELLKIEIGELRELEFDMAAIGFRADDLKALFTEDGEQQGGGGGGGGEELQPQWQVLIECESEEAQVELLQKLEADGIKNVKALTA